MKKIVAYILVISLFITTGVSVAFADSWKDKSGNGLPPGLAKKFMDLDGYDWAEMAIERMANKGVIKGIGNGLFAPKKAVTKLEAIVMALRVMEYEDEAKITREKVKQGKKKLKNKERIQDWALGYVTVALDEGILEDYELFDFKLNEPAKRHEVAKYIVRALIISGELKYTKKELENMDVDEADLSFHDIKAIPLGSLGYVSVANEEGIITGYPDETFRPNKPVTRAEMAVLIARLDDNINNDEDEIEVYRGEVEAIDDDYEWIKIDIGSRDKRFDITDETEVVFEDDVEGDIEDIKVGDEVKVKANEYNEAVYIEVDRELYYEYEGEVEAIDDEYEWIKIDIGSRDKRFDIIDETEVVFEDDVEADIEDIIVGDKVKVKVNEDNDAVYIEVDRELYYEYEGEVEAIDDEYEWIKIDIGSRDKRFDIIDETEVVFEDDVEADIEDIIVGDKVKVKVNEDNDAVYIEVDRELYYEYEGEVEAIDDEYEWIKIDIGSRDKRFDITDETEVVFEDDVEGDIEDIKVGDDVKVRVNEDEEVVYIEADRELSYTYEGEVEEIDDDYDWIEIDIGRRERRFETTYETEVVFEDDAKGDIEDIKVGDDVKVRVNEDDELEYIEVDRELDYDVYEGLFVEIDDEKLSIIVSKKIIEFEVDSDVNVKFKDKEGDLEDLIVGDVVKVIVDEDDDEVIRIEVDRNYSAR